MVLLEYLIEKNVDSDSYHIYHASHRSPAEYPDGLGGTFPTEYLSSSDLARAIVCMYTALPKCFSTLEEIQNSGIHFNAEPRSLQDPVVQAVLEFSRHINAQYQEVCRLGYDLYRAALITGEIMQKI